MFGSMFEIYNSSSGGNGPEMDEQILVETSLLQPHLNLLRMSGHIVRGQEQSCNQWTISFCLSHGHRSCLRGYWLTMFDQPNVTVKIAAELLSLCMTGQTVFASSMNFRPQ